MEKKKQKAINYSILSVIALLLVYFSYSYIRCPKGGLSENSAIEIANKYMPIHFEGTFTIIHQSFNEDEKEWNLSFSQENRECNVDCLVDRCGVFNVVGISAGCKSLP